MRMNYTHPTPYNCEATFVIAETAKLMISLRGLIKFGTLFAWRSSRSVFRDIEPGTSGTITVRGGIFSNKGIISDGRRYHIGKRCHLKSEPLIREPRPVR